jgi:hypothetical protein
MPNKWTISQSLFSLTKAVAWNLFAEAIPQKAK